MALLMTPSQNAAVQLPAVKRSATGLHALPALPEREGLEHSIEPVIQCLLQAVASVDKATRSQIEAALVQLGLSQKSPVVLQTVAQGLLNDNQMVAGTCAMILIRVGHSATPFVEALPAHWAVDFVRQELPQDLCSAA
jgi:hypothetical protein